ncbi:MAG: hypothetical protein VR69_08195 [Peptococcaceae bacterium BRH_c4b]|nr:MAG: hypothetical protein VR69_08195 [Peptococcaceae bacterium BRH_c4b]
MIKRFIEKLKKEGKSSLTVRQYNSSWRMFEGWLRSEVEGATSESRGVWDRGNGDKTDIQFLRTSNPSVS